MTIANAVMQQAAEARAPARAERRVIARKSETFGISGLRSACAVAEINTRSRLQSGRRADGLKVGLTSRAVQQQLEGQ